MVSGFTTGPQSIAPTTRCTRTLPSLETDASITCATKLPNDSCTAIPRPRPSATGFSQPAFSATNSSTRLCRGWLASNARRNSNGSLPARSHSVQVLVIQIFPIPRILPHLGEVGRIPARRLNARDFSEDDLGEKVGVIAAAQVGH